MRVNEITGGEREKARGTQARALGAPSLEASQGWRSQQRRLGGRGQGCRGKSAKCGIPEAKRRKHRKKSGWTPVSSTAERACDHQLSMPVWVLCLSPLKLVNPQGQDPCLFCSHCVLSAWLGTWHRGGLKMCLLHQGRKMSKPVCSIYT